MTPRLSIVTLTHNKLEITRRCLPTHLRAPGRDWELIVVDNGSDDGTPAWLDDFAETVAAAGASMQVIKNTANDGCSTARNQGIAAARGRYIAFLDNDVALRTSDWQERLIAVLDADPTNAYVGPKMVYPAAPHDVQCAGVGISPNGRVQFIGRGRPRTDPALTQPREVQCLISAACMSTRQLLDRTGGFDEAFNPVEFEDFDLIYRARAEGLKALYEPSVEMYHCESVTTAGTPSLGNTRLIVEHGMLFRQRWQHLFAEEGGPSDSDCAWARLPGTGIEDLDAALAAGEGATYE